VAQVHRRILPGREKEAADLKAALTSHVDAKVEGHRFAAQLRPRLIECTSVEEVDTKFDQEVAYIESLLQGKEVPKGTGVVEGNGADDDTSKQKLDKNKERLRNLAGIKETQKGGE
jgi:hypothetical protein